MDFDIQWFLLGLPLVFAIGWLASRFDTRQWLREQRDSPRAYYKGLNLLLNEQYDKAIDAFIEAVQQDPDTSDLHFALGNLFRRRGEYERAVRVHQHLLQRADLAKAERDRAQYALAQDFLKAGLFDRAEQAFATLHRTAFDTEARLALLTLHERSRDWPAAIAVAQQLENVGTASFASRIAHYWCEVAVEADARQATAQADEAIARAQEAAPQAPRPLVLAGQRAFARGDHAQARVAWGKLLSADPRPFGLVARDYAHSALATGAPGAAFEQLRALCARAPSVDLLAAMAILDTDATHQRERLVAHMHEHPTLSAALSLLMLSDTQALLPVEVRTSLRDAMARAAKPLQRYRCAACAFEAQTYFWQCPGCLSWDSYPPQRLEDQ
ncbi:MAG: lipopolysaccharide assembly protein LapB [Burkholderiaceae bacterium]